MDTTPGTPLFPSHLNWSRWEDCSILSKSFCDSQSHAAGLSNGWLLSLLVSKASRSLLVCALLWRRKAGNYAPCWQLWRGAVWIAHQQQASLWDLLRFPSGGAKCDSPRVTCSPITSSIKCALQPVAMCPLFQSLFRWGAMEGHSWRFWICSQRRRKEEEKERSTRENRKYAASWQDGSRSSFFKVSNPCVFSELCVAQGRMVIEGLFGIWCVCWYSGVILLLFTHTHIYLFL